MAIETPEEAGIDEQFEPVPSSARVARSLVHNALEDWGRGHVAEAAALCASELVTNAIIHARTPIELHLRVEGTRVRLEVTDFEPIDRDLYAALASPLMPRAATPAGRGLAVVDRLAARWGIEPEASGRRGKIVWCEFREDDTLRTP